MKPSLILAVGMGALALAGASTTRATPSLFEYAINMDGIFASSGSTTPMVALPGQAGFNFATGVGSLSFSVTGAGSHYFGVFFDHALEEDLNTFFNEYASVVGSTAAGQRWEVDEPGYPDAPVPGDIFYNLEDSALDNRNALPVSSPDDVSMALSWNFSLAADEEAELQFLISTLAPASGFYLQQIDPHSQTSLYFSSTLTITGQAIPEPVATLPLLSLALAGVVLFRRGSGKAEV